MFGQWGFGATEQQGITVLLHGAPGTGKSLASEAIGYEVGKPLKVGKPYETHNPGSLNIIQVDKLARGCCDG